jgi:hypothetical protein
VDVNCGCEYTECNPLQPLSTTATNGQVTDTDGHALTNTGTTAIQAGLSWSAILTAAVAKQTSHANSVVRNVSPIKLGYGDGTVYWHYKIDDAKAKNDGVRLDKETFPITEFKLRKGPEAPSSLPPVMKISVGSFWSMQKSLTERAAIFHQRNNSILPCYMNLYTKISLEIPSNLAADSCYMERTKVHHSQKVVRFEPEIRMKGNVHLESTTGHVKSIGPEGKAEEGKS